MPCGLDKETGVGMIEITGSNGTLYPSDLIDALETAYTGSLPSSSYYNDFRSFWGF